MPRRHRKTSNADRARTADAYGAGHNFLEVAASLGVKVTTVQHPPMEIINSKGFVYTHGLFLHNVDIRGTEGRQVGGC